MPQRFVERIYNYEKDELSKITWDVSVRVEKRKDPKNDKRDLVEAYDYRGFSTASNRMTAHLKPTDKREGGVIAFGVYAEYELHEKLTTWNNITVKRLAHKGSFAFTVW